MNVVPADIARDVVLRRGRGAGAQRRPHHDRIPNDDRRRTRSDLTGLHRLAVEEFLQVAAESYRWYESFRDKLALDPVPFTYDYVMRGGRISPSRLEERSPALAAAIAAWRAQTPG